MGVNPVEGFKNLSTPKKAAVAAGAVAAAGSLAYAAKTGKVGDTFEGGAVKKGVAQVADGYKTLGKNIAKKTTDAVDWVKSKLPKAKDKAEGALNGQQDGVQPLAEASEAIGDAAQAAVGAAK